MSESDRRTLLWRDLNTKEIEENIFKFHNYDGVKMHRDLQLLEKHDRAKKWTRATVPIWLGITGISAYNVTRFGVLSKTGQAGALAGLVLGAYLTQSAYLN